jgi:hypothetical protein
MHMSRVRQASRRRGEQRERGAALLEFALILPLLAMLVFGIIEFGVIWSDQIGLRGGTRDAGRAAAVGNVASASTTCSLTGGGATANDNTKRLICLTKDRTGLDVDDVRVKVIVGSYTVGSPIIVCAQQGIDPVTGIFPFLEGRFMTSKVETRIEQATASFASAEELAPTGGNWTWCAA